MIAQGQFTRLLNASTEERSQIFRKLFRTERYQSLQIKLLQEAAHLEEQRKEKNIYIEQVLHNVQYLQDDPKADALAVLCAATPPDQAKELLSELISRQNAELEQIEQELKKTEAELEKLQQSLGAAEQASNLHKQLTEKQAELKNLLPVCEEAKKLAEQYADAPKQLDELAAEIERTKAALDTCRAIEKLKTQQINAKNSADLERAKVDKQKQLLDKLDAEIAANEKESADLENCAVQKEALAAKAMQLAQRGDALRKLAKSLQSCRGYSKAAQEAASAYRTASEKRQAANAERDRLESAFLDAQAGLLAQNLAEGQPCPVCGNIHHPALAQLPHTAPTEAQVNDAKKAALDAGQIAENASVKSGEAKATLEEALASLRRDAEALLPERFSGEAGSFSILEAALKEENEVLAASQSECNAAQKQNDADCRLRKKLESQHKEKVDERTAIADKITQCERVAAECAARANELEKQVAEKTSTMPYPSQEAAQNELQRIENKRDTLRRNADNANTAFTEAKDKCTKAQSAISALQEQQQKNAVAYTPEALESMHLEDEKLHASQSNLRAKEKELTAQLQPNQRALEDYCAASAELAVIEQRQQWVSALSATANGTLSAKQKIRLETYIQMTYLDRILVHANTRLMQMTSNQYELERIDPENQRSQSGLDLGVIDHYNGSHRSVKTLSGGESFKASLALALGLSDEVQISAGGIRLDTLFLDEGFGTLDDESLEQAIQVLNGLTEGNRLVGIISHVETLKERIDTQIVVRKSSVGGSTASIVLP